MSHPRKISNADIFGHFKRSKVPTNFTLKVCITENEIFRQCGEFCVPFPMRCIEFFPLLICIFVIILFAEVPMKKKFRESVGSNASFAQDESIRFSFLENT